MMADCFNSLNAEEIVALLWNEEYFWREDDYHMRNPHADVVKAAADAIEQLVAENAKLKAERDAAVRDMLYVKECAICKYIRTATCEGCHIDKDRWEWRGSAE